jgi:hypothetical protein
MTDGATIELIGGDTFEVPPGHDAWVVGDEPWISVDYAGRRLFAKSPRADFDRARCTLLRAYWRWPNQARCSYRAPFATISHDQA